MVDRLAVAMKGIDLEPDSASVLRTTFEGMFAEADVWCARAREIRVTSVDQTREMKLARESRLALRDIRVNAEHARKRLKEDSLRRGKAIDGIANVIKALIEPIEAHLLEQELFAERAAAAERDALRDARQQALSALGVVHMPAELGQLDEAAWNHVFTDAVAAKKARDEEAARAKVRAEEALALAAKSDAEVRKENERLRRENAAREKEAAESQQRIAQEHKAEREKLATERAAADQRAALEAVARKKAEAEAAALRKAEEERVARDAEMKKPTKAKYATLVEALKAIGILEGEPKSMALALVALSTVGELAIPSRPTIDEADPLGLNDS